MKERREKERICDFGALSPRSWFAVCVRSCNFHLIVSNKKSYQNELKNAAERLDTQVFLLQTPRGITVY